MTEESLQDGRETGVACAASGVAGKDRRSSKRTDQNDERSKILNFLFTNISGDTPPQSIQFHNLHTLKRQSARQDRWQSDRGQSYTPPEFVKLRAGCAKSGAKSGTKNTPAGVARVLLCSFAVGVLAESAAIAGATHARWRVAVGCLGADDGAVHAAFEGVVEDLAFPVWASGDGDVAIGPDADGVVAVWR